MRYIMMKCFQASVAFFFSSVAFNFDLRLYYPVEQQYFSKNLGDPVCGNCGEYDEENLHLPSDEDKECYVTVAPQCTDCRANKEKVVHGNKRQNGAARSKVASKKAMRAAAQGGGAGAGAGGGGGGGGGGEGLVEGGGEGGHMA
jgi:hypothetical protein